MRKISFPVLLLAMLVPITAPSPENPWSNVSIGILASINALAHLVAYA